MTLTTAVLFLALSAVPARAAEAPKAAPAQKPAAAKSALKTEEQKTLYALGSALGTRLTGFSLAASEMKFVEMGFKDAALGVPLQVDFAAYDPKIVALHQARVAAKVKPFLDKSAKEASAVALTSGLIYKDIKVGTGDSPKATDKVKVHYHGTFPDGAVFDSSVQRGQPAEFLLNQVIPCWTEGVQRMKVGGKANLVCPAAIAYGEAGRPGIPAGATLVFEVELLEIVK